MIFDTFGHKISHNTVTRRFKKAGYSFLKPRIIQQLNNDQKIVQFNFLSICLRIITICSLNLCSLTNHVFVMVQTIIYHGGRKMTFEKKLQQQDQKKKTN